MNEEPIITKKYRVQNMKACIELLKYLSKNFPHLYWLGFDERPDEFIPPTRMFPIIIYITGDYETMFYSKEEEK